MTTNTINYRKYQEDVRHNKEMERLTGEAQAEAQRHNIAYEQETVRSNQAKEQLQHEENIITSTHYGKVDFETARHNMNQEYYQWQYPHAIGADVATVNKTNAEVGYYDARAGQLTADAGLKVAQTKTEDATRGPKVANIEADTANKNANTTLTNYTSDVRSVEAKYAKAQQLVNIAEKAASTFDKFTRGTTNISNTVQNVLKAVTLIQ